jgi:hypothetical protein
MRKYKNTNKKATNWLAYIAVDKLNLNPRVFSTYTTHWSKLKKLAK